MLRNHKFVENITSFLYSKTVSQKLWIDSVIFEGTSLTTLNQTSSTGSGSRSINPTLSHLSVSASEGLLAIGFVLIIPAFWCNRGTLAEKIGEVVMSVAM